MNVRMSCSLPMYDLPEIEADTQALWSGIAARLRQAGVAARDELLHPTDLRSHWLDPDLLLSQSCGYPLLSLPRRVRVVATPAYRAEGCDGGWYRSALMVRHGHPAVRLADLRGGVCALNDRDSNSGMNLLRAAIAPLAAGERFFRACRETGSHVASIAAIAAGQADLAAIDCVTLALLKRHRPACLDGTRFLGWTAAAPGLPLVSAGDDATIAALRGALAEVQADTALRPVRDRLLIDGFVILPEAGYETIADLERQAILSGYPELA